MTPFTDDDLKRLKEQVEECSDYIGRGIILQNDAIVEFDFRDMAALLARLEAAERMFLIIESKMSISEK